MFLNLKSILILLFVASATPLFGQSLPSADTDVLPETDEQDCGLTLSGKVVDHDTRAPLVGATVYIPQLKRATVADEYGNYHFHNLCQGSYTIRVTYVGYEEISSSLRMTTSTVRDLQPHSNARQLGAVEITGARIAEQAQPSQVLSGRELEETRGLSLGESLKQLTGVSSVQTGPSVSKPVIHGLYGNRVLILNNGVRHESQQWGNEHAPEIDPFIAQTMEVVKGAAGVRYGSDAIGGIVLVNPKPLPDSAGTKGEVSLVGNTNNRMGIVAGMLEGRTQKLPLSWRLHTSLKKAGSAQTPEYNLKNTAFEEQNFSANVGYKRATYGSELYYSYFHTQLGLLSSAHIGNTTDLQNAIGRSRPEETGSFSYGIERPYQNVTHHLVKAKGFYSTGNLGELQFTYGFQDNVRQEYDRVRRATGRPEVNLHLVTHTTDLVWEHKPIGNFSGSIGASTVWQNNTYTGRKLIPFYNNFTTGVFLIEKWRKDNLQLEAGVRYDHKNVHIKNLQRDTLLQPKYVFHNFSGSFGAMYDLGYHLTLSGNIGYASRSPMANELFIDGTHQGAATYERGNPDLISEHAINTVATIHYHSNRRLNGELSVYYNTIKDYIYLQMVPELTLAVQGAFLTGYYQQADARFWGGDLSLQYNITDRLTLDSKTSLVRAINTETNSYLPFISPDRTDNSLRYSFNNTNGERRLSDSYFSVGGLLVSKQYRSDQQSDPVLSAPDGYFLLHAEAGTTVRIGNQVLEIGVTGNNLLDEVYRDYQNRMRFFADEIGRTLLLRIKVPLDIRTKHN